MKGKRILLLIVVLFILILLINIFVLLFQNKTFFKDIYIGVDGQEILIPKYSFFRKECCMTAATFYSLKSKDNLKKEIDDYMKDFDYFDDDTTYGYKKGNLFIQRYEVVDKILYREIIITY